MKQFVTGNGHLRKLDLADPLSSLHPDTYKEAQLVRKSDGTLADHNEIDAIWLSLQAKAVDQGQRSFLGLCQRKLQRASERRQKRAQRRQAATEKAVVTQAEAKAVGVYQN